MQFHISELPPIAIACYSKVLTCCRGPWPSLPRNSRGVPYKSLSKLQLNILLATPKLLQIKGPVEEAWVQTLLVSQTIYESKHLTIHFKLLALASSEQVIVTPQYATFWSCGHFLYCYKGSWWAHFRFLAPKPPCRSRRFRQL